MLNHTGRAKPITFAPMRADEIKATALKTIELEAESITGLARLLDDSVVKAVEAIHQSGGRVVVSGIGKSAIIAQKMVATFNSTGTPGLYMHAADAIHGDLGMIQPNDVVMVISKSGSSPEIKVLVPFIRRFGNTLIGMVGNMNSYLAQQSDIVLNTTVSQEACPNNLAPTSSTTAQMVMGDVLAVCLMTLNGFTDRDFARYHPGGALGKKLFLRVSDLIAGNAVPRVLPETPLAETVIEMTSKLLGATAVVAPDGTLFGIITDGDLRRMLLSGKPLAGLKAMDICSRKPKQIGPGELAVVALDTMKKHDITHLLVVQDNRYIGILHLHDLIKEGII